MPRSLMKLKYHSRSQASLSVLRRLREELGIPLSPGEEPDHARQVEVARAAWADDAAFDAAWTTGRTLTLEQAVALARET